MDHVLRRFPLASKMILNKLDDQTLVRSQEASKKIDFVLRNEKIFWIRIIESYSRRFAGHEDSWKQVIKNAPTTIVKQLAIAMQAEVSKWYAPISWEIAPLHIGVQSGNLQLCQYIIGKTSDFNPKRRDGMMPLQIAVEMGSLAICRLIIEKLEGNFPADCTGSTALHDAIYHGRLEICRLIIENVKYKDLALATKTGRTPLHYAARMGHFEVCKLIIKNAQNKNSDDSFVFTLLHAITKTGETPIDIANQENRSEIVQLFDSVLENLNLDK